MYPTLFGTVSGFEARVYGRPPVELSDQWIDIRSDLPLNGSDTAFAVIRRRVDTHTLTWIGFYRAAHELYLSRGGHCGAGIWLVDTVAPGALLVDLLQRLVSELSALALENGKFVRSLSAIEAQMNWHEDLGKKIKASLLPYQVGGLRGADLPATLLDGSAAGAPQLPWLIDAAQAGAGLREFCRAVVTADARVSRNIESSGGMRVFTPEALVLAGGLAQADAARAAAEARRQLEHAQQTVRAEFEAAQQQLHQDLAQARQQLQDLTEKLRRAGLEREELRSSLAAAEDQAAHARGEVRVLLSQCERLRQLLDVAEQAKYQFAAEAESLRRTAPLPALPSSVAYGGAATWTPVPVIQQPASPPAAPLALPAPTPLERPAGQQPPDASFRTASPAQQKTDWKTPSPTSARSTRRDATGVGLTLVPRWQVLGLGAVLVVAVIWIASRPSSPPSDARTAEEQAAELARLDCDKSWNQSTRYVSFSVPVAMQDAERLASLVWRVECAQQDRWSCKSADIQRMSVELQRQIPGGVSGFAGEPTQFIQVSVPRACKGERDGQWALIGQAIQPASLAPVASQRDLAVRTTETRTQGAAPGQSGGRLPGAVQQRTNATGQTKSPGAPVKPADGRPGGRGGATTESATGTATFKQPPASGTGANATQRVDEGERDVRRDGAREPGRPHANGDDSHY